MESLDATQDAHWRNCDPCECQQAWLYKQEADPTSLIRQFCYTDPEWNDGAKWCYVEGFSHCTTAVPSTVTGEDRTYKTCGRETCGDHKKVFKDAGCCGSPMKFWPLQL